MSTLIRFQRLSFTRTFARLLRRSGDRSRPLDPVPIGPAIGRRSVRREDEKLVRGEGRFVNDVPLVAPLHVHFVRSDAAVGSVIDIDCARARAQSGVAAVYKGSDLPALNGPSVNPLAGPLHEPLFHVLAGDEISAVGQPIAAVLATCPRIAADAADRISVAIQTESARANDGATGPDSGTVTAVSGPVAFEKQWRSGDPEKAFADAASVVRATIRHSRVAASPLEPRSAAADFDTATGVLTVWLSTQTPHRARADLARILNLDMEYVHVVAPDVGGAFGMKASLYPEDIFVAFAALAHRRAVRWSGSRAEDMLAASHGRGGLLNGELALDADGNFLGLKADIVMPLGAWMTVSAAVPAWNAARILPGPYRIPAIDLATKGVITNTAPVGIYRGAGRPEAAMLMERLVETAARKLGVDPIDLRRRNLIPASSMPFRGPTGIELDSGDYPRALALLADRSDYASLRRECDRRRQSGAVIGLGLALFVEPCGRGWESARVEVTADGVIFASVGTSSQGHGRETAFGQIVADVFGVHPDDVVVRAGDSRSCPPGIGALASRSTAIGGSALLEAAREAKCRCERGDLRSGPVVVDHVFQTANEAWGYGVHLAVVSVDPETGTVLVEKLICLDDIGTVVNPVLVEGQISGGVAQGIGEALLEAIVYDQSGQLLTGSLMDYALPRAAVVPPIQFVFKSTPSPNNPLGAKGVGEAGSIGAPAAVLNATLDALAPLGVHDLTLPMTPSKIWQAIQTASKDCSVRTVGTP
ncbi:MAG: xanthine dehydrogenase family protein molybdopterin-binding subunit [Pseudomonadota bacterium]